MTTPTPNQVEAAARAMYDENRGRYVNSDQHDAGWSDAREPYLALARAALTAAGVAPQERTSERCDDCGDKLDYVAGADGHGCYPHCWRCWYKEHPGEHQVHEAKLDYVTRVTLVGRNGRVAENWDFEGVELFVQDNGRTLKVLPLRSGE